jgi:hypothetical protein
VPTGSEQKVGLHHHMTSSEVTELIVQEIGADWRHTNAHGVDLRACLVTPERRTYCDPINDARKFDLWLVLVEHPDTRAGYKIVFDERDRSFGLAMTDQRGCDVFLGSYGTFMETLDAM